MKLTQRYWHIIFPLFFIGLIWAFSAANGEQSQSTSAAVASAIGIPNALARKLAHFSLFMALGFSFASFFKGAFSLFYPQLNVVVYSLICPIVYAAIDEIHQLTVAGRNGSISDIFIDSLASIAGVAAYVAIFCFWRLHRRKSQLA